MDFKHSMTNGKKHWKEHYKKNKELKRLNKQENLLKLIKKHKQNENGVVETIAPPDDKKQMNKELNGQQQQPGGGEETVTVNKNTTTAMEKASVKKLAVSTVSIAVPGSILENAQSSELRTYLAGQIARAACIFKVDEIIVFDDCGDFGPMNSKLSKQETSSGEMQTARYSSLQLARILQYLECPQYLRKFFFPIHKDLQYSGLLNPLDAPHHLRQQSEFIYREGVITNKPAKEKKGSYVNIGLLNECMVDKILKPGIRVTVKLDGNQDLRGRKLKGIVVSPSEPTTETGIYWGYSVRVANSLSEILLKSPYENGYDLTIGTSDKGENVHGITNGSLPYNHALIVYGGLKGLETALENDDKLDVDDPNILFDHYLNTVPNQGSRTIRTEEAILISLAVLAEKLNPITPPMEFNLFNSIPQSDDTGIKQFDFKKIKRKFNNENGEENGKNGCHPERLSSSVDGDDFNKFD